MCDQTKEIQTLYGSMPNKWIISSSGRYMFVKFVHGSTTISSTGFSAKIHFGNKTLVVCTNIPIFLNYSL